MLRKVPAKLRYTTEVCCSLYLASYDFYTMRHTVPGTRYVRQPKYYYVYWKNFPRQNTNTYSYFAADKKKKDTWLEEFAFFRT